MELYQVRYFLALCDTLNFTRAAEACNVAQPSLTRAIQNLEGELGGPLFHRERQRTHLTDLGKLMRPYLDQMSNQAEAAKARAKDFSKLLDAPLSIGVMCTIGPTKLLGLFSDFQSRHPGIEISLLDAKAKVLAERLEKGDIDIAIYGTPSGIDDTFHAMELFTERFVIGFGPGHAYESLPAVRLQDLHQQRYLSRVNCEFAEYMRDIAQQRGIEPLRPYRSERDDWIQVMALAGLGFTFIPEFAVTVSGLHTRLLIEPEVTRTIHLVTVRGRPFSPAVGAFVRLAMAYKPRFQVTSATPAAEPGSISTLLPLPAARS
ncbi:MAG: LysR family transcriptional regulator [Rhodospirillales bacterium]|nr:LysR family transcriptional regulator [Rhodospirillales bacterium]